MWKYNKSVNFEYKQKMNGKTLHLKSVYYIKNCHFDALKYAS